MATSRIDYRLQILLAVLVLGTAVNALADSTGIPEYMLVRAPQRSAQKIYEAWKPVADYLSQETGARITLKIHKDRGEFETDMMAGKIDLGFVSPYYYLQARKIHGYIPLLRSDAAKLQGILVADKDSGINSIRDLQNKVVAFPSPNAFGASLLIRAIAAEKYQLKITANYVGTHDNGYRHVVTGKASASGGVVRSLEDEPQSLRNRLKIIFKTDLYAPHPLMVNPRVPAALRDKIVAAVLKLTKTEAGRRQLKSIKLDQPVIARHDRDYRDLELLNLGKYATLHAK